MQHVELHLIQKIISPRKPPASYFRRRFFFGNPSNSLLSSQPNEDYRASWKTEKKRFLNSRFHTNGVLDHEKLTQYFLFFTL